MDALLCLIMSATLTIKPNKSQFFRYEDIAFDCAALGSSGAWTVRRNTSSVKSQPCKVLQGKDGFGDPEVSSCVLADVYPSDSGLYWCTSGQSQCSNFVNITVTSGVVILDTPAFPLTQGDEVTLRCVYKERYERNAISDFNATSTRTKLLSQHSPNGQMVIQAVSLSDEGFLQMCTPHQRRVATELAVCENQSFDSNSPSSSCDVYTKAGVSDPVVHPLQWYPRPVCTRLSTVG
ncbi:uncharacterized protein KZ484_020726 isoform 2-T2 [Pholidichthys leucotaenia]